MRVPVGCFAQTPDGDLIFARGDQNMKRWDGLDSAFADAGVPAPSTGPTLAESGTGTISGTIFGLVRYLDADGRVSNISPLSDALTIDDSTGAITGATHATPIVITSVAHGLSNGDTVRIAGVLGNAGANGTFTIANVAADTFELVGSVGSGTYAGGGNWYQGAGQIDYTNIPAPSDARVTRKQVYRSKNGSANVFYLDLDTDVDVGFLLSDTSESSTNADSDLGEELVLTDSRGDDLNVTRHGEPPNFKRVVVHHYDRLFSLVDAPYREGAVILSNGSPTVTGIGTAFTSAMVGWELYPLGTSNTRSYEVTAVNTGTQALTIEANYEGDSDPFALYELRKPGAERVTLYFSEPGLPYSVDHSKALTLQEDPEAGEMSGAIPYRSFLYLAFQHRLFLFSYNRRPEYDADTAKVLWRGLVNQRCWTLCRDGLAYLLDRQGPYMWAGNFTEPIGLPIQPLFDGDAERPYRVHWQHGEHFHCCYNPQAETIRWFVCLSGGRYPRHAIAFHREHKRWWVEEFPFPITASCLGTRDGRQTVFLGSTARRFFALDDSGSLDGVSPADGTVRGTVTSAGILSLVDSSATFAAGVVGMPVQIVSGKGAGQMRIIAARASATKLEIVQPWRRTPDTTSVYQIGGIRYRYRTGWLNWDDRPQGDTKRSVQLRWEPTESASLLEFRVYEDDPENGREAAVTAGKTLVAANNNGVGTTKGSGDRTVDTTKKSGHVYHPLDDTTGARVQGQSKVRLEIEGVPNGDARHRIEDVTIGGATGARQ